MNSTDLGIATELGNRDFRNQFFRTERDLDIPAQLKALRKLRGLKQQQLAERTGESGKPMKQSAVCRLERSNHGKWNLETLVRLAEALEARLSVVIEPYEAVIARYKSEARGPGASAATAANDRAYDRQEADEQGLPARSSARGFKREDKATGPTIVEQPRGPR